ncbi:MAG: 16S rRNA (cytosine(967)-C(5))-methyltransferase RsmB [Pseudoflavonifractor sp.]
MAETAREIAVLALAACERQGAWSEGLLKQAIGDAALDSRDAAFATRICAGVLQNRLLLNFYISQYSSIMPAKLEPKVRCALQIGIYQMLMMDRVPHSAAVNESVNLARRYSKNPKAPGLVNGVLRNISRAENLPKPKDLSTQYSHPDWLVKAFRLAVGEGELEALLAADNREPPIYAQTNLCRSTTSALLEKLAGEGVAAQAHPWLPDCLELSDTGDMTRLQSFRDGDFYVQDPAARWAVLAADPKPGMRVLDACAAPGGKSVAAAIAMENKGEIMSCDIHENKLPLIAGSAKRLGLTCIETMVQDGKTERPDWREGFDLVLADVPCSGLGVIRKKPDIRYKDPKPLAGLPAVQAAILENLAGYVKPGGGLLYSTCTLVRAENEAIVRAFTAKHKDFTLEAFRCPQGMREEETGMLTFFPHRQDTDGFFIAKLRKNR